MAQTSWPFENIDTTEVQFSQWARHINEGIRPDFANELEPFADDSGLNVKVKSGQAMVRGHYYASTAEETLTITTPDATNPRIDSVVLELDIVANSILLKVVAGTPAASPVAPTLTQSEDGNVYQFLLGNVAVAAGVFSIAAGDVTDLRTYMFQGVGKWTTATRPENPIDYQTIGYNTELNTHEVWNGTAWTSVFAPITTEGDLAIGDNTGTAVRLPIGAADQVLTSNGTTATWEDAGGGATAYVAEAAGGTFSVSIPAGVYSSDALATGTITTDTGKSLTSSTRAVVFDSPVSSLTYPDRTTVTTEAVNSYPITAGNSYIQGSPVVYHNGVWVTHYVERDGSGNEILRVLYSTDAFASYSGPITVDTFVDEFSFAIDVANGVFFILGFNFYGGSYMSTSTDGISWTQRTVPGDKLQEVAFGNGVYVTVGRAATAFSSNLSSWTASSTTINTGGIIFDGTQFVSPSGTTLYKSTDGNTWTTSVIPISAQYIAYDSVNSRYVIAGGNSIAYSDDAITWTITTTSNPTTIRGINYGAGWFYIGSQNSNELYISQNGEAFRRITNLSPEFTAPSFNNLRDTISFAFDAFYSNYNDDIIKINLPAGPDQYLILSEATQQTLS